MFASCQIFKTPIKACKRFFEMRSVSIYSDNQLKFQFVRVFFLKRMPMFTKQCDDIKRDYHHYRYSYDPSYEHSQHKDSSTPKPWHRDSYDDLFRQFERLQMKAESIAEKDPVFAIRLENLAKQFADGRRSRAQRTNNQTFNHSTTPKPPPPPPPLQQHPKFTTYQEQPSFHRSHVPTPPPSSQKPPNPPKPPPFYPSSNSFAYNHARHNSHQQRPPRHNHSKHGNQSEYMYVLEENKPRKITVRAFIDQSFDHIYGHY
jgi:hypothetical protein